MADHPSLLNARQVVAAETLRIDAHAPERAYWLRFWRAVVLSPTLEVCEALLRGERVPASRLDPVWRRRFRAR